MPHTVSIVGAGTRRTVVENGRTVERYPAGYDYGDALRGDLRFALRNEALDLGLLSRAFATASQDQIDAWIRAEPSSTYGRRAWFLYEHLTGSRLALPDAPHGNYVPALDPGRHLTWTPTDAVRSRRHRVIDNLPGTSEFCPMVRRSNGWVSASARQKVSELSSDQVPGGK